MNSDCRTCKFIEQKEINEGTVYGYCIKTKLILLSVKIDCSYYEEDEKLTETH